MAKALLFLLVLVSGLANALVVRDPKQVTAYWAQHACPVTGKHSGACPGWVVDHIVPLCAGGADRPENMVWQPKVESLEKDKAERAMCRWITKMKARKAAENG